jgi:hypothetical protein
MTPYEAWYGRKPSVDHLRTFGCVAHVKTVTGHLNKLADRSTPMVMIGYEAGTKAYRAYNPVNKKLVVTRDVLFEEEKSWNWSSVEPVHSISDEIFNVVYADDQEAGTHVEAETEISDAASLRSDGPPAESVSRIQNKRSRRERRGEPQLTHGTRVRQPGQRAIAA